MAKAKNFENCIDLASDFVLASSGLLVSNRTDAGSAIAQTSILC
jgi:hypothetical protein